MLSPLSQGKRRRQVAALCCRETGGKTQVLLITSRDTGRWVVPKGWPIDGLDGPGSALQEAWEEAGVKEADIVRDPIGSFDYDKGMGDGPALPIRTSVYMTRVRKLSDTYPEASQRDRVWVSPSEAARRVNEPQLQAILRTI